MADTDSDTQPSGTTPGGIDRAGADWTDLSEQLHALWLLEDVLIEASGTYANGRGTFTECWARPVPEFVGGEPGTWEVLVFGSELPHSLATTENIRRAKVLYAPAAGRAETTTATTEAMTARLLDWHLSERDSEAGCALRCGYGINGEEDRAEHLAQALADAGLLLQP